MVFRLYEMQKAYKGTPKGTKTWFFAQGKVKKFENRAKLVCIFYNAVI